jgi:hypothetical protein
MYSAAVWRLPLQPNDFKLKAINGSNSRTIQTKFHIENERSPPKHQNVRLKIFKLCNLEYYPFLTVIVSIRNLKQTASPRSHYKPTLNGKKLKFLMKVSLNETLKRHFLGQNRIVRATTHKNRFSGLVCRLGNETKER